MWEHFHHQADIGIRGKGNTPDEAFAEGAVALMAVICSPEKIEAKEQIQINCQANDLELLFVDWLNAIIYETATNNMLFSKFEVNIAGSELNAIVWGEKIDHKKHEPAVEVKAATYSMLSVKQDKNGLWTAQCIVDV